MATKKTLSPRNRNWTFGRVSRNVHRFDIKLPHADNEFRALLTSDCHWDNPHCEQDRMKKLFDQALELDAPILDIGDFFCAMQGKYDKRASKSDLRPEHQCSDYLDALVRTAAEWLQPYSKILTLRGEGNHECVDDQTEVLTSRGWIKAGEVTLDDVVAQRSNHDNEIFYTKPLRCLSYEHSGEMVRFESRSMDMMVTPNHRVAFLPSAKQSNLRYKEAGAILKVPKPLGVIPTNGVRKTPGVSMSLDELEFLAWLLTDGSLTTGAIFLYQSKPAYVEKIRDLLTRLGYPFKEGVRNRNISEICGVPLKAPPMSQHEFRIPRDKSIELMAKFSVDADRNLPPWLYDLTEEQFDFFLHRIVDGDGSRHKSAKTAMMLYGKEPFLSSFQQLCINFGYRAMLSLRTRSSGAASYHCLNIVKRGFLSLAGVKKTLIPYLGKVYCLTTPSGNFFARRNGKVFLTGNSSIKKRMETDLTERLTERLKLGGSAAETGGFSGYVKFFITEGVNNRSSIKYWYHHGHGGGGPVTKGVIQTARRAAFVSDADIIHTGHVHEQWIVNNPKIRLTDANKIEHRRELHVCTPGFKEEYGDGHGGWHIERGAPPKPLGAAWLRIYREGRNVEFEVTEAR